MKHERARGNHGDLAEPSNCSRGHHRGFTKHFAGSVSFVKEIQPPFEADENICGILMRRQVVDDGGFYAGEKRLERWDNRHVGESQRIYAGQSIYVVVSALLRVNWA